MQMLAQAGSAAHARTAAPLVPTAVRQVRQV
jgi:hypothetical protein